MELISATLTTLGLGNLPLKLDISNKVFALSELDNSSYWFNDLIGLSVGNNEESF